MKSKSNPKTEMKMLKKQGVGLEIQRMPHGIRCVQYTVY